MSVLIATAQEEWMVGQFNYSTDSHKRVMELLQAEDPLKAAYDLGYDDYMPKERDLNSFSKEDEPALWVRYSIGNSDAKRDMDDFLDVDWDDPDYYLDDGEASQDDDEW